MKKLCCVSLFFVLSLIAVFTFANLTLAQQDKVIKLTYASVNVPGHPYSIGDQRFFDRIDKATNGRVKIKPYWSSTLISNREGVGELKNGIADIAYVMPGLGRSGVDMIRMLPSFFSTPLDVPTKLKIFRAIFDKFPEFRKEYEGIKILAMEVPRPSTAQRFMLTKPINSISDLKGMRIRCSPNQVSTMRAFGAEGVQVPMMEAYESLQKGLLDALLAPAETYKTMHFAEVVKYEIANLSIERGMAGGGRAMNLDAWSRLPQDIQKVFEANSDWWTMASSEEANKADLVGRDFAEKSGVKKITLPESDINKFHTIYQEGQRKAVQALDSKGLPGTEMYDEVQRLAKMYGDKNN